MLLHRLCFIEKKMFFAKNVIARVYTVCCHSCLKICLSNIFCYKVRNFMPSIHLMICIEILRKSSTESKSIFQNWFDGNIILSICCFRQKLRDEEDKVFETRRQMIQRRRNPQPTPKLFIFKFIPQGLLLNRKSIFVTTAFSIVIGIFAYYYKTQNTLHVDVIR